jgi:hypothetical protein
MLSIHPAGRYLLRRRRVFNFSTTSVFRCIFEISSSQSQEIMSIEAIESFAQSPSVWEPPW